MKTDESTLLRNLGFDEKFFEKVKEPSTYVIKREKIRKVVSENAVTKIEVDADVRRCREAEDREIYGDQEENSLFGREEEGFGGNFVHEEFVDQEEEETEKNSKIENNLAIFKNCSENQMNQLNRIFREMNSTKDEKVLVKAYKSKLKTKFYEIYEANSQQFKEKIKYKIFHKCNYPSCGRTFASSGWLRSHFNEHLSEIKKNKFSILFENFLENCKNGCFYN